ncbi:MAG TPA: hypothetical protein VFM54_23780 [Micromonosporaceae bacterium]|nr:hypothetical protein [Micromonosporaceae bacterium]
MPERLVAAYHVVGDHVRVHHSSSGVDHGSSSSAGSTRAEVIRTHTACPAGAAAPAVCSGPGR